jgi:alkanesulfonate monooxygenase SsuD/methylene tetrahydromethanopterin reductase-like flavin-dependent oxidoreductase (luciferase family)
MPADPVSFYAALPRLVEESGFDSLFVGDHLFAAGPSVDAFALAASFAARTSRLTVGTGVLQLAMREPVAAAKQVATIDCLSGGRFILGVGAGGEFADEWAAVGVSREGRGRRLDHHLALAAALWSGETVRHEGEFATVAGVVGSPLPTREGGPPIWVGGRSDAALARAACHDGWLGYAASTRRVRASLDALAARGRTPRDGFRVGVVLWTYAAADATTARERIGELLSRRYRQDFERYVDTFCAVGTPEDIAARAAEFRAAGATDILFSPQCAAEEFLEQVERLAEVAHEHA